MSQPSNRRSGRVRKLPFAAPMRRAGPMARGPSRVSRGPAAASRPERKVGDVEMDWDNVRVFLAVARGGQFVAAGKRLELDHATVSRRIAALEATVGAKLFDRRKAHRRRGTVHQRGRADGERVPACPGRNLGRRSRTRGRCAHRRAGRVLDLIPHGSPGRLRRAPSGHAPATVAHPRQSA